MADEYQIQYEYTDGNTISFKTSDLEVTTLRPKMRVDIRVDGKKVVTDPNISQLRLIFSAIISGNDMDTLHSVQTGSITYSGAYPRTQTLYWDGDSTETNIEVAITSLTAKDIGAGWWRVNITMLEKDQ